MRCSGRFGLTRHWFGGNIQTSQWGRGARVPCAASPTCGAIRLHGSTPGRTCFTWTRSLCQINMNHMPGEPPPWPTTIRVLAVITGFCWWRGSPRNCRAVGLASPYPTTPQRPDDPGSTMSAPRSLKSARPPTSCFDRWLRKKNSDSVTCITEVLGETQPRFLSAYDSIGACRHLGCGRDTRRAGHGEHGRATHMERCARRLPR